MNINADGADPKTSIRKDLIRDELLQHAAGLFAGRGYANTSMQDIAQAVGLSRSAVYHYFSNKEDVLRALLDGSTAAAMEHLTRLRNETSLSAAERLREAVRSNVTRRLKDGPARRALEYVDAEMPKELLAQFNKIRRRILQFHIVVLSTFGVMLGFMLMGQPFGVVMGGIGVIANAGVIVNNNIVLIDTYDRLRREGVEAYEAIMETCRERARPVVLTAVTAILGVLPIAFGMNIEFLSREITVGAPATQWWIQLATAMVYGMAFATPLTLVVTPAALMLRANAAAWFARRRARKAPKAKPVPLRQAAE